MHNICNQIDHNKFINVCQDIIMSLDHVSALITLRNYKKTLN